MNLYLSLEFFYGLGGHAALFRELLKRLNGIQPLIQLIQEAAGIIDIFPGWVCGNVLDDNFLGMIIVQGWKSVLAGA